jgi:hypothetical protein
MPMVYKTRPGRVFYARFPNRNVHLLTSTCRIYQRPTNSSENLFRYSRNLNKESILITDFSLNSKSLAQHHNPLRNGTTQYFQIVEKFSRTSIRQNLQAAAHHVQTTEEMEEISKYT